ncbi:MAG TPA: hypothetical protein VHI97_05300, partial [Actinomycetota bacterium]|nr:hypothetical protein [Actinomycetota bacterium]
MRRWSHWDDDVQDTGPDTGQTVRRVARVFQPYRKQIGVVALAIVAASALGVVNPILIKVIFDTALFC